MLSLDCHLFRRPSTSLKDGISSGLIIKAFSATVSLCDTNSRPIAFAPAWPGTLCSLNRTSPHGQDLEGTGTSKLMGQTKL
jgi:hypothetical protein